MEKYNFPKNIPQQAQSHLHQTHNSSTPDSADQPAAARYLSAPTKIYRNPHNTAMATVTRQPVYRRPSWAQRDKSYEHYMRKDLAADRSPGTDYGLENFSYDEDHLSKWAIPEGLTKTLPPLLHDAALDWQHAGAAVCTALDRIAKLDEESLYRGYPEKTTAHLSRRVSNAVSMAGTPPMSSPLSPMPMRNHPSLLPLEKLDTLNLRHTVGNETPPITPVDSKQCPLPAGTFASVSDGLQLTNPISPISVPSTRADSVTGTDAQSELAGSFSSTTSTGSTAVFDENAWETFLKTYEAEVVDARSSAWVRFKGCGYTVDKLRIELGLEPEHHAAIEKFSAWWATTKPAVARYEEKIRELEIPSLSLIRLERAAKSLSI